MRLTKPKEREVNEEMHKAYWNKDWHLIADGHAITIDGVNRWVCTIDELGETIQQLMTLDRLIQQRKKHLTDR